MAEIPVIPGYRIERELGKGGMARVYLAHEEKLERHVALKVLLPALAEEESVTQRFLKEAKTAARLRHSNIVSIYDVGKVGSTYYFTMEYLEESLKDRIQRSNGMPAADALALVRAIASALDYAHREGLLHRDIKPDNIMFCLDGTPVLADFGIAKAVDSQTKLTKTGMSIGTPHYMSPEQIRGFELDGKADLYSLGIVLFEMLTGKVPYDATDTIAVCMKHVQEPVPKLADSVSVGAQLAVPSELARYQPLIDKLLAKDPKDRVQSGKELIREIDELHAALSGRMMHHFGSGRVEPELTLEKKTGSGKIPGKVAIGPEQKEMIGKPIFSELPATRKLNPLFVFLTAAIVILVVLLMFFLGDASGKNINVTPIIQQKAKKDEKQLVEENNFNSKQRLKKNMYTIQAGVFADESNVQEYARKFMHLGNLVGIIEEGNKWKIVFVGEFTDIVDAEKEKQKLENQFYTKFKIKILEAKTNICTIQVGVFADKGNAQKYASRFINLGYSTEIVEKRNEHKIVFVGKFANIDDAEKEKQKLQKQEQKLFLIRILKNDRLRPIEKPEPIEIKQPVNVDESVNEETGAIGGVLEGVDSGQSVDDLQQAIRIASVQKPRKIKEVKPVYPQVALEARIQGVVIVEAISDIYGRVRQVRVISGHPLLNDAALAAIRQWIYEPYILNGKPKPVIFTATVTFSLQNQ